MVPAFLRTLFWDTDTAVFDPQLHPGYTVARILEHGNPDAVAWMRQAFTASQIVDVLRTDGRLSPRSAAFWAVVYRIPAEHVAALRDVA